jgi:hypothetical protein
VHDAARRTTDATSCETAVVGMDELRDRRITDGDANVACRLVAAVHLEP